jgi:hypothetical protein
MNEEERQPTDEAEFKKEGDVKKIQRKKRRRKN